MPNNKTLYVFEPYEWTYCGGAIGVIAKTFSEAVTLIVASNDDGSRYKRKYFSRTPGPFKKDESNQWLLTHELEVVDSGPSRVCFNNWNYA